MSDILLRTLVDSSLRALLVAGAVAVILAALRVRAGGLRHAAWTAVLGAMLLMPVLPYCVVSITIPVAAPSHGVQSISAEPESPRRVFATDPLVESPRAVPLPGAAPSPSPAPVTDAPRRQGPVWPIAALATYGLGMLILLSRLALGWRAAARIVRTSRRIVPAKESRPLTPWPGETPIYESKLVVTPVTVGVFAPSIILPVAWRLWPGETFRAVLAHELAHVRRRDPVIGFLAHINRCVFWFHPLSWWLKRTLAATAEHACDDAAVRTLGEARRYAEILLDMAEAMRRSGGRLLWHGVGIDGSDLVGQRIERVLRGELFREPSLIRKSVVATGCAATIFFVAACRPQLLPPAPLQEPPRLTEEQARRIAEARFQEAARKLTPQQQKDLEAALKSNPEDLVSLQRLLLFYWARVNSGKAVRDEKIIAIRRAHILWLIEKHPDSELAGSVEARLFPEGFDSLADSLGYARAKELWLAHTSQPDATPAVLGNAANFLEPADKALAEEMLVRAHAKDPKGPWSSRLGAFYAAMLVGRYVTTSVKTWRDISAADPQGPYAESIRKKLAESKDDVLLTSAAQYLVRSPRAFRTDFDPDPLAKLWLERALVLNPGSIEAHTELIGVRSRERARRIGELLRNIPPVSQYQAVSALPEAERFEFLADLARAAYLNAENSASWDDLRKFTKSGRERSKKYAEDLLELARRFRNHPNYGTAIYKANMILGSLALREGDRKGAVRYMRKASQAPASEELAYSQGVAAWSLLRDLLKEGERESVIEFLEEMAQTNVARRAYLRESAASIRRGQMPRFDRMGYVEAPVQPRVF